MPEKQEKPDNLTNLGVIMSNFDYRIDENAEEELKAGGVFGEYTAWNFWSAVWWDGNKFKAMIKRYRSHVNTIESDSLRGIMDKACEYYGCE